MNSSIPVLLVAISIVPITNSCLAQVIGTFQEPGLFRPPDVGVRESVPVQATDSPALICSPAPCVLPSVRVTVQPSNGPVIAVNPEHSAHLMLGANDWDCNYSTVAGFYGSSDGGSSWNQACLHGSAIGLAPTATYDANNNAYIAGVSDSNCNFYCVGLQKSTDNGSTWSSSVDAVLPLLTLGLVDVPELQADISPSSPYEGTIYISATQFDVTVAESQISVSRSTDGGDTWTTVTADSLQVKPSVDQFSRLAVGNDGTVYLAWQRCQISDQSLDCGGTRAKMLLSKSIDGGNTWSPPKVIAAVTLTPDSCECAFFGNLPNTKESMSNVPVIAVDNSKDAYAGNLYVSMYNWTGKQMRVQVVRSRDGGATWEKPVYVSPTQTQDQFFPSISVGPSGNVGITWLDRRHDHADLKYQPFAAVSTNGGASFGRNYALTSHLSNPYLDYSGGTFMGISDGNAWGGDTTFYGTWPDTNPAQYMHVRLGGLLLK